MEVEEEKLDFEIEDELQLKVQNDEVLDGDDEEPKVDKHDFFNPIVFSNHSWICLHGLFHFSGGRRRFSIE